MNESTANDYERSPARLESNAVNYATLLKFPGYRVIASRMCNGCNHVRECLASTCSRERDNEQSE